MNRTRIKPMSAKREQQLRDAGRLAVGSTFQRPIKGTRALPERPTRRHPRPTGPDSLTVDRVLRRDEGCCVVCGISVLNGERGFDWSLHHRRGRDGKADSNSTPNLIVVHGSSNVDGCHGRIHKSRTWARPLGYWVSRNMGADPRLVPVFVARLDRLVWFYNDGWSDERWEAA